MDNNEIKRYTNVIINQLQMRGDYSVAAGMKKKVLLVEGFTDRTFIDRIKQDDVRCFHVMELVKALSAFSKSKSNSKVDCKDIIISILQRLANSPEFFDFPKGSEKWPLFGVVDNDFDDSSKFQRIVRLFFTDTHDIETLLLSTDSKVLTRIDSCAISEEDTKRSLYLAYQLFVFRQAIFKEGLLPQHCINEADGSVAYEAFVENDKIILSSLLSHMNKNSGQTLSNEKLNRFKAKVAQGMKKHLDNQGVWKKSIDSFDAYSLNDFWIMTNGHDILSAVRYVNPEAMRCFQSNGFSQNRSFEVALCKAYDLTCFTNTHLYQNLNDASLVCVIA